MTHLLQLFRGRSQRMIEISFVLYILVATFTVFFEAVLRIHQYIAMRAARVDPCLCLCVYGANFADSVKITNICQTMKSQDSAS